MHIDAGVVKLNDLLDWREVHEEVSDTCQQWPDMFFVYLPPA
jgi:hypothetical protein